MEQKRKEKRQQKNEKRKREWQEERGRERQRETGEENQALRAHKKLFLLFFSLELNDSAILLAQLPGILSVVSLAKGKKTKKGEKA